MKIRQNRSFRWWFWLFFLCFGGVALWRYIKAPDLPMPPVGSREFMTNAVRLLEAEEADLSAKYFVSELLAQKQGALFDALWDKINSSTNKLAIPAELPFTTLLLSLQQSTQHLSHGITILHPAASKSLNHPEWKAFLEVKQREGWRLHQCELRHIAFTGPKKDLRSTFYCSAQLLNSVRNERAIIEGNILVHWKSGSVPAIEKIDASQLQIRSRAGTPPFQLVLNETVQPIQGSYYIDPLILRDLNSNGFAEIILGARNLYFSRERNGSWSSKALCDDDPRLMFTAIIEDFTGDGVPDFLTAKFDGLFLYQGAAGGKFPGNARLAWSAQPHLKYGQALTCGDIDGDGDLDLFLGQYKVPYEKGQMPVPYFNANDGNPSFLLVNDGQGNFTDVTDKTGLARKRFRRVYSASFIDFDRDADLDLIVVSDFAGVDGYENDGRGKFTDATEKWFTETHSLGMAHSFTDFDRDGSLDFLMIGMNSPTVDRLASMKATRPYDLGDAGMRERVAFGNRLYFGQPGRKWKETGASAAVARTGWSWGCATPDLDNDGFPDLYIANGHATMASVRDYETEFWLHDIYMRPAKENPLTEAYFRKKFVNTRGQGWSYGGYEKNRLFLNLAGTNFVEAAWLFGLALEADSRNVVSEDLNGDGRMDLIVTTFESYPQVRQTVQVYENQLSQQGNWIELTNLKSSNLGRVFSATTTGTSLHALVAGDGYRSQSSPKIHIGLGKASSVTIKKEPDGQQITYDKEKINRKQLLE